MDRTTILTFREEPLKSICFAILGICAALMTPAVAWAGSPEDIKAAYAAWDEAFGKGDAKAIAAFYAENSVFLPPTHDVIEGPAGVEKFFSGILGMGVTGHKLELVKASGDDKTIYGAAKWSAKARIRLARTSLGAVSPPMFSNGRAMAV